MKRFFITAFVCILGFCTSAQVSTVFAATPTPSPTILIPPPQSGTPVSGGVANEPLSISGSTSIDEDAPPTTLIPLSLGATMDTKKLSTPNMTLPAKLFSGALPFLYPFQLKSLIKAPADNQYFISGKTTMCVQTPDGRLVRVAGTKAYKTAPLPKLAKLIFGSLGLSFLGTDTVSLDDTGVYNLAPESQEQEANPECGETAIGDVQKGEDTVVTQPFDTLSWVEQFLRNLFSGLTASVQGTVSSNTLVPHANEVESKTAKVSAAYLPSSMDASDGKGNGKIANPLINGASVNMNFEDTAKIDAETKAIACAVVPKGKRSFMGLTDADCARKVTQPNATCSTGALPPFPIKSECKLKTNSFGLSDKLIETIESAASAYNVPASLMLGIMYGEGAFESKRIFKTAEVDTYLDGCTPLPNCDPKSTKEFTNIVPFIPVDWPDIADAVQIVDAARKPDPCNLTDGIYAVAKHLHRFQFAPAFAEKKCFGINLLATNTTTANTCSTWKDENAESAIRFWEFGNGWNDTTKSCATNIGSCLGGGGFKTQCATGGDTCETIDKRYTTTSTVSHNGCIWNVYKSN